MKRTFDENMMIAKAIKNGEITREEAINKLNVSSSYIRTLLKVYESRIKNESEKEKRN